MKGAAIEVAIATGNETPAVNGDEATGPKKKKGAKATKKAKTEPKQ